MWRTGRWTDGFTLLETLVVLAVSALAATGLGLALPELLSRVELDRTESAVVALLADVRRAALIAHRPVEVVFDGTRRTLEADGVRAVPIPSDVGLVIEGAAWRTDGSRPRIVFMGDGSSSGAVITLVGRGPRRVISVSWLTGRIRHAS